MTSYVIRGGEEGKARLSVLAGALRDSTLDLLQAAGLREGMSFLDVGCGGGDVTLEMARLVGPVGSGLGIDIDATKLELARREAELEAMPWVEFREMNVDDLSDREAYDLVYARFLLSHMPDPARIARRMVEATRPGGAIVVEDIDHSGIFSHPASPAIERYVRLYNDVVRSKGADPEIGPRLPEIMRSAGIEEIRLSVVQPVFMEGEAKRMHAITLRNIAGAVMQAGLASESEIESTIEEIERFVRDPHTIASLPRIFQVRGYR